MSLFVPLSHLFDALAQHTISQMLRKHLLFWQTRHQSPKMMVYFKAHMACLRHHASMKHALNAFGEKMQTEKNTHKISTASQRRRRWRQRVVLASFILCSPIYSQICWSQSTYNLVQIYDFAHAYDAEYQQNLLALEARGHSLKSSSSGLRPAVTLSGDVTHSQNTIDPIPPFTEDRNEKGTSRVVALNVQQSVFDLEALNNHQQGKVGLSALEAERQQLEQAFLEQVTTLFFDTLLAQDDLRLAKRQEKTLDQQLAQAQERFEVGLVSVTDVLEAQASLDNAQVDTLAAQNQLVIARENLLLLTGLDIASLATLAQDFPIASPSPDTAQAWIDLAKTHSPALKLAQANLRQAKLQHNLAKRAYIPSINLFGRYASTSGYQSGFDQPDQVGGNVGLNIEMPLYLGGSIGNAKRETTANWMAQRAALTFEQRQLTRDIVSQFDQVMTDIRRVKAQQKSIRSNTSALEATQAGYVAGIRNIVDVLVAQQQLFTAERNYAKSRYDYLKRTLALKARAGLLDRKALENINQWLTDTDQSSASKPSTKLRPDAIETADG